MHKIFFLSILLLFFTSLSASENQYSIRGVYGWSSVKDLGDILLGDVDPDHKEYKLYSVDAGKLLYSNVNEWPIDLYAKAGFVYYNENNFEDCYGADVYIKAFWNLDFLDNRVRLGLGEGLSYTTRLLQIEELDAELKTSPTSKFLNYLDLSIDFDLGKLIGSKPLEELYLGVVMKHRSGIFGTFSGVHGGSNYNSIYLEKNF
ncbi:hypothetical protein [Sulfurimonas microaerophilic]|uniref:hypothetical protein n=1 Tax=Sulfurimonas microaerophilic TaxID=3058392 RepID=UPI00271535DF|nr:hypothetical protein [Sulfurimonas sp. hsl 1-7]